MRLRVLGISDARAVEILVLTCHLARYGLGVPASAFALARLGASNYLTSMMDLNKADCEKNIRS